MRKEIHPENYREVVFTDASSGKSFISRSTVQTDKTTKWEDGKEYPLYQLTISSYSHPFYTGAQRLVDTQGRIDKFNKKYGKPAGK
jgi:large subunit ribosomal protein L31